ncbi:hypothetical protein [Kineococcus sp. G2]|uniref:hypothetical protein n=1 Tax=Kineococcus sp. G2 TaxID=3127484 RepID=UPI00301CE612
MAHHPASALARPLTRPRRGHEDDFGSGLLRGAVCGAALGGAGCLLLGVSTALGRDLVVLLGVLGAFVGSLVGLVAALGALLVLGLAARRGWEHRWGTSLAAAVAAGVLGALGTVLVGAVQGAAGLGGAGATGFGAAGAAVALWQVRRLTRP